MLGFFGFVQVKTEMRLIGAVQSRIETRSAVNESCSLFNQQCTFLKCFSKEKKILNALQQAGANQLRSNNALTFLAHQIFWLTTFIVCNNLS